MPTYSCCRCSSASCFRSLLLLDRKAANDSDIVLVFTLAEDSDELRHWNDGFKEFIIKVGSS